MTPPELEFTLEDIRKLVLSVDEKCADETQMAEFYRDELNRILAEKLSKCPKVYCLDGKYLHRWEREPLSLDGTTHQARLVGIKEIE